MGEFITPMKAASGTLPSGEGWISELKWDGMRMQAEIYDAPPRKARLRSGSGRDITTSFPELDGLADAVGASCVLDGEAVVMDEYGPSFSRLQNRIHVTKPSTALMTEHRVIYLIFDLLTLEGHDLTSLPLRKRRELLESLIDDAAGWRVPPADEGPGERLLALAVERQLEGVVAKRADSPYRPGRSQDWIKVKVRRRQEFVVGGWNPGTNSLEGTVGSLIVGFYEGGEFRCAGSVGSGLRDIDRDWFVKTLVPRDSSPFHPDHDLSPTGGKQPPQWVEPREVVEVAYGRWAIDSPLWHPTYCGRRVDRDANDVVREDLPVGGTPPEVG